MPDWSYHPVLRPLFSLLPPGRAQRRVLDAVGAFGGSRMGGPVVSFLGHAEPPAALGCTALGIPFRSPVGVGADLPRGHVLAGLDIARIGSTRIFVSSDLGFLGTDAQALHAANDRLLALVAHDRAGFGAALVADGLAVVLTAIWGVRRGATWLWWTLLAAGLVGFGAAIGVHLAVGYLDAWHLAPAFLALAIFAASLSALRPFLGPARV